MMTQKERLVDLLKDFHKPTAGDDWDEEELEIYRDEEAVKATEAYYDELVDFLLSNGVIVPPFKAGDTVYRMRSRVIGSGVHHDVVPDIVSQVRYDDKGFWFDTEVGGTWDFAENDLGKIRFRTREEAEKALKEREQNS